MITITDYLTRRATGERLDVTNADELTDAIREAADDLLAKVNLLLTHFYVDAPDASQRTVNSGWRPESLNKAVGGAPASKHLTGHAIDLGDADRKLARWCAEHQDAMRAAGLCAERPEATPTWVHLQSVPVASGAVFYWPSNRAY